uniref:Uncharacterized protein n=1 Tax=Siphoviridae sp. ctquf9 TaxID=2826470 RepID=A0A8S5M425_9CAUD|nr:MAG TPA: hypothetical protein [Siphoviridae sp. ctquf9]
MWLFPLIGRRIPSGVTSGCSQRETYPSFGLEELSCR